MHDDVINEIAQSNYDSSFAGGREYRERKQSPSTPYLTYRVWNPNPQNPNAESHAGKISIITKKREDETFTQTVEYVDKVSAVILFASEGRKLCQGSGPNFRVACQSHDGVVPSVRVKEPLCRDVTASDLAQVFSKWRNFDQAKIEAKIKEVTEGTSTLQVCGIKTSDSPIMLCPYSKKNKAGQAAPCKPFIYVRGFDTERQCEFNMELTGRSIQSGKFIAPFHEFFKFLRYAGPQVDGKQKGLPCFAFRLDLSAAPSGAYFYLNVSNWKPIQLADNRKSMMEKAYAAREAYEKDAHRLSKEDYERERQSRVISSPSIVKSEPESTVTDSELDVLFDEDDVKF